MSRASTSFFPAATSDVDGRDKPGHDENGCSRLLHHRGGLAEQQLALFLGADRGLAEIRIDLLGPGIGAHGGGALADGFQPALQMREVVDVLALVLVRHHPGIARHVGDRIVAGDEFAVGETLVEHAVEPVGLVDIAGDGVVDLFLGVVPEMVVLPGHRTEPAHLPERPLDRVVAAVDVGGQFKPEFLAIAPNNRIPAMVDHAPKGGGKPISIFESGAMLLYLAEKTATFLPADIYGRYDAIQWTFWQMGGLGPMAGQNHHFRNYAQDKIDYAITRYVNETNRLYGVLNKRLSDREFIAGDYSIADMASYPWVVPYKNQGQNIDDFPHLKRWLETIGERPATVRAYARAKEVNPNFGQPAIRTEEERKLLFGQTAAVVK